MMDRLARIDRKLVVLIWMVGGLLVLELLILGILFAISAKLGA